MQIMLIKSIFNISDNKKGTELTMPFLLFLIKKLLEAISDSSSYWEAQFGTNASWKDIGKSEERGSKRKIVHISWAA